MNNAEFKQGVVDKIQLVRSRGVRFSEIEEACPDGISLHTICGMLNAGVYPMEIWEAVDNVMDGILQRIRW